MPDELTTFRHETLTPFRLNLLSANDKRSVLETVIKGQSNPEVAALFQQVVETKPLLDNASIKQTENRINNNLCLLIAGLGQQ